VTVVDVEGIENKEVHYCIEKKQPWKPLPTFVKGAQEGNN
jgi:hypothetical protein